MQPHTRRYRYILGVLALGLLAGAALLASPAQAASGVGPFFPEPAWDRKIAPAARFLILTNWVSQAVLDKETGLVWERTPSTPSDFLGARFTCANQTTGNRKGWRLPSMPELASLIDPTVGGPGPTLPLGHPFVGVQSSFYWSATTTAESSSTAWVVDFFSGLVFSTTKGDPYHAWCVRGGTNADQY